MRQLANMAATMHVTASIEDVNVKMEQPQAVMTPPASEEHNPRARSDSGLSDMDSSSEDIGDVEPAEYFEGGKIPVFRPVCQYHYVPTSTWDMRKPPRCNCILEADNLSADDEAISEFQEVRGQDR